MKAVWEEGASECPRRGLVVSRPLLHIYIGRSRARIRLLFEFDHRGRISIRTGRTSHRATPRQVCVPGQQRGKDPISGSAPQLKSNATSEPVEHFPIPSRSEILPSARSPNTSCHRTMTRVRVRSKSPYRYRFEPRYRRSMIVHMVSIMNGHIDEWPYRRYTYRRYVVRYH